MTVHEAAHTIIREEGRPMAINEVARQILSRGLRASQSKNPVQSFATTIQKTIREGDYNDPELAFIPPTQRRIVGLPEWQGDPQHQPDARDAVRDEEIRLRVSSDLAMKLRLATQAQIADSHDETLILILRKGLSALAPEIKAGLLKHLETL